MAAAVSGVSRAAGQGSEGCWSPGLLLPQLRAGAFGVHRAGSKRRGGPGARMGNQGGGWSRSGAGPGTPGCGERRVPGAEERRGWGGTENREPRPCLRPAGCGPGPRASPLPWGRERGWERGGPGRGFGPRRRGRFLGGEVPCHT